jgi:uncharacterized LabA/DUF88 family protein
MTLMNSYDEVLLVVDQDQRFKEAQSRRKKTDPDREAEAISTLVKVLGRRSTRYALVSEHDERGLKAYHRLGFEVVRVSENRGSDVNRFIAQHAEQLKNGHVTHLVLVTTDSTFAFLANQAERNTQISVWAAASSFSREMTATMPPFEFRDLDEMLPAAPKVAVLLDFENIWYGLKKLGWAPEPKVLIDAIRNVSGEFGEIKKLTAYADWELLARERQGNIQRDLVQLDVETQYLINMRGKNTADMKIANDIRDLVERTTSRDDVDVIVLATGDRDFRDIVKTAKDRGKRVIILAVHNGVSKDLITVASEARYIDDLLKIRKPPEQHKGGVRPWHKYALEMTQLSKATKEWIPLGQLPALGIQNATEFVEQAGKLQLLKVEKRTLADGASEDGIRLNKESQLVKVVGRLVRWVPDRLTYCLKHKGMPYVDTGYLARGLNMDRTFQEWNVGQERREAEQWLELLNSAGVIHKRTQAHPVSENREITAWWLPGELAASKPELSLPQVRQEPTSETQAWPISQPSDSNTNQKPQIKQDDRPSNQWPRILGAPA